jgi:hypothetical protein
MSGELAPERGVLPAEVGDSGTVMFVEMSDRCRDSCFLILSCSISASILRSDSSSRSRCASTRRPSRSCSPIFISSSSITALSIAWLYFESRSAREDVVFRACLSKSSLATSISRSCSWSVRLVSRKVVISFSRVFCAAFASAFDSLYFLCSPKSASAMSGQFARREDAYLPFLDLKVKPLGLLS